MYIASLIFGIIAICTSIIPVLGVAVAVISLIITIIAFCIKRPTGRGLRIAGLVLTLIAIVVSALLTYYTLLGIAEANEELSDRFTSAATAADLANAQNALVLAYVKGVTVGNSKGFTDSLAYTDDGELMIAEHYYKELVKAGYGDNILEVKKKFTITVSVPGKTPSIEINNNEDLTNADMDNNNEQLSNTEINNDPGVNKDASNDNNAQLKEETKITVTKEEMYEYLKIFASLGNNFKMGNTEDLKTFIAVYVGTSGKYSVKQNGGTYYVEISKDEVSRIINQYFGIKNYTLTDYEGDKFYTITVKKDTVLIEWPGIGTGWTVYEEDVDIKYSEDKIIVTVDVFSPLEEKIVGKVQFTLKVKGTDYYIEKIENL
ncbi:MAG: DUF4190 domain-containing protein [Clostridia bacterium]|nr:DUF4190 domain-containing protein [Clostridia bacterium]